MPRGSSPHSRLKKGYSSEKPAENADRILDNVIEQIRDNWLTIEERRVREWDSYQRLHRRTAVSFGAPPPPTPAHFGGAHVHGEEADYSYLYDNPDGPNHNTVLRVMIQAEERQRLERAARYGADGVYADDDAYAAGGGLLSSDLGLVGGGGGDENHVLATVGVGHAHDVNSEKVITTGKASSASSPPLHPLAARDPISFIGLAGNNGPHARAYGQASTGRNQTRVFFDIATIPLTTISSQPLTKDNEAKQGKQEEHKLGGEGAAAAAAAAAAKAKAKAKAIVNMSPANNNSGGISSGSSSVAGLSRTSCLSPFVLDGTIDAITGLPYALSQSPPTCSSIGLGGGGGGQQHATARSEASTTDGSSSGATAAFSCLSADGPNDQKNKMPADHLSSQQLPSAYPPHTALADLFSSPEPVGRIVFELYEKACPKAVANFCKLVSGSAGFDGSSGVKLDFSHTSVYSAKRGVELTIGLLNLNSVPATSGTGIPDPSPLLDDDDSDNDDEERKSLVSKGSSSPKSTSANTHKSNPNNTFISEERLNLRHVERGLLSMKSVGPNRIGSFFSITLGPAPELDFKQVIIGHVVEGHHVLEKIEALIFGSSACNKNEESSKVSTTSDGQGNGAAGGEVDTVNEAAAAAGVDCDAVKGGDSGINTSIAADVTNSEVNDGASLRDEQAAMISASSDEEQKEKGDESVYSHCECADRKERMRRDGGAVGGPNEVSEPTPTPRISTPYTIANPAPVVSENKRKEEEVNSSVVRISAEADEHDNKSSRAPPVPIFAPLCGVLAGPIQTPVGIERLAAYLNSARGTSAIKRALCAVHPHVFARWDERDQQNDEMGKEARGEESVTSSFLPTEGGSRQVVTRYVPSPPPLQEGGARRAPRQSAEGRTLDSGSGEEDRDVASPSPTTRGHRSSRRKFRLGPTCKEVGGESPPAEKSAAGDEQDRARSQSGGRATSRKRGTARAPPAALSPADEVGDLPSSGIPAPLSVFHIVRKQLPRSQLSVAPSKPMFGDGGAQ